MTEFVRLLATDTGDDPRIARAEKFAEAVGVPLCYSIKDETITIYMETDPLHSDEIQGASERINNASI